MKRLTRHPGGRARARALCGRAHRAARRRSTRRRRAPTGLHAFLLRARRGAAASTTRARRRSRGRRSRRAAARTTSSSRPAATSTTSSVLFTYTKLQIPALAIAHQLPWMTGVPYALWAHVRWESADGKTVTPWSAPFGFNMRWRDSDYPAAAAGAGGPHPLEADRGRDALRGALPGHQRRRSRSRRRRTSPTSASSSRSTSARTRLVDGALARARDPVHRRQGRAEERAAACRPTGRGAAIVHDRQPAARARHARADRHGLGHAGTRRASRAARTSSTPGFAWTPSAPVLGNIGAFGSSLYRVYIFTDDHCVNAGLHGLDRRLAGVRAADDRRPVRTAAVTKALANGRRRRTSSSAAPKGRSFDATGEAGRAERVRPGDGRSVRVGEQRRRMQASTCGTPAGRTAATTGRSSRSRCSSYRRVRPRRPSDQPIALPGCRRAAGPVRGGARHELRQGVAAGRHASASTPWVSGLAPNGRVVASASKVPTVHDSPLVAWQPAVGATTYEMQLSRKSYPWRTTWSTTTSATSVVLPLGKARSARGATACAASTRRCRTARRR